MAEVIANSSSIFKPEPITIKLGDETYELVYDLNALCELEKYYSSVNVVLKKVLGSSRKEHKVAYKNNAVDAKDITVDNQPLSVILAGIDRDNEETSKTTATDTLNMLYCGILRGIAEYNEHEEITGYKKSKAAIAKHVTFRNLGEVNLKIATAIIRDLVPTEAEAKNETGAETAPEAQA